VFESKQGDGQLQQKELTEKYIKVNIQKIAQLLKENLYYPASARRRGTTGLVVVKFTLDTDAVVHNIEVVESSSEVLSKAAIETIKQLSEKFPKPSEEVILNIPINYHLN
jgi:protein TonB